MRVLITREAEAAERTADLLRRHGHEPVCVPLTTIVRLQDEQPWPDHVQALVATSRNAFAQPAPPDRADTPVWCVGERTGEAARAHGWKHVHVGTEGHAAALAQAMIDQLQPDEGPLLYWAGRDRKPDLERDLVASGFKLVTQATYAAKPVPVPCKALAQALSQNIDAVLLFSERSTALLISHLEALDALQKLDIMRIYAIAGPAANPLAAFSLKPSQLVIAATPDLASLVASLDDVAS